ncbi:hypothetical protein B0E54_06341 [Micromonospora sp. MH99]|nr:hypothetical protein [Micromonospora sp. MH99]
MSCVVVVAVMAPSARRTRVGSSCFHVSPTRLRLGMALWLSTIWPFGRADMVSVEVPAAVASTCLPVRLA